MNGLLSAPRRVCAAVLLVGTALLLAPAGAHAQTTSWHFKLIGFSNQSMDDSTSQVLTLTGSGSFTQGGPISGGGTYRIVDSDHNVVGSGTWTAAAFGDFQSAGPGGSPGEAGRLTFKASFDGTGIPQDAAEMDVTIRCSMWWVASTSSGYPWAMDFAKVGPYDDPQSGGVMFNIDTTG